MLYSNNYYQFKKFHTFHLDIKVNGIYSVSSVKKLLFLWHKIQLDNLPVLLLGEGSNVLFINNFNGIIILNKIIHLKITESPKTWFIHVGAGNNWHQLVKQLIKKHIFGLENMALIPGSVGAAPIQNIGAYGMEFKDICYYVDILNLINKQQYRLNNMECQFNYRDSIFKHKYRKNFAIISVGIKLNKLWKPKLNHTNLIHLTKKNVTPECIYNTICKIRKNKLPNPIQLGNAGSFFKNPIVDNNIANVIKKKYPECNIYPQSNGKMKLSAGWLIEQCNLKGYQHGGASVYMNQALILINKNNATGIDVVNLASFIIKAVFKKFSILLEPEVRFIGKYGEINAMDILL